MWVRRIFQTFDKENDSLLMIYFQGRSNAGERWEQIQNGMEYR